MSYEFSRIPTTSPTIYTMGEASPPAAVVACTWPDMGYVLDTTVDHTKLISMSVIVDDTPLIVSGGGPVFGGMIVR